METLPLTPSCPKRQLKISQRCNCESQQQLYLENSKAPHQVENNVLLIHFSSFLYNIINSVFWS